MNEELCLFEHDGVPANGNVHVDVDTPEKREVLLHNVERACAILLDALLIDWKHDHNTVDTPKRMAKMFVNEVARGRFDPMPDITYFPNAKKLDQMMVVGPVDVKSMCSHHFVPFIGKAWLGVLPSAEGKLIGLSKFARITDWVFRRPQIQEEAVQMLAEILYNNLQPKGLGIVVRCQHLCTYWRGVEQSAMEFTNSAVRGAFNEPAVRAEFFNLIRISEGM